MDPSSNPATPCDRGAAASRSPLVATIVAAPEHTMLRAQRPEVLRVKVVRSCGTGATTVLAGWPEPDSWATTNGGPPSRG